MNLIKCYQTHSTWYKGARAGSKPVGVLWHDTAAGNPSIKRYVQPYETDANYNEMIALLGKNKYKNDWNHIEHEAGLNAWIGLLADGSMATVQAGGWDKHPWGCGGGNKGSCNGYIKKDGKTTWVDQHWIQFEICDDGYKDEAYFKRAYQEACEFTAYICELYNIDPLGTIMFNGVEVPTILCHADSYKLGLGGNHGDIYSWFKKFGYDMTNVRKDVAALMGKATQTEQPAIQFNEGDVVKIKEGVTTYYDGTKMASWVPKSKLYVRDFKDNNRIVISTLKEGAITGTVFASDLILVEAVKKTEDKPAEVKPVVKLPGVASTGSKSDEKKLWDFLLAKIGNEYGVAGLMGNLYAESALRSNNLQQTYEKSLGYTDDTYTAAVDSGDYSNFVKDSAGYGLAQWTYWSRKQALLEYAKSVGKSICDFDTQMEFLWKELSTGYKSTLNALKAATSVADASTYVLIHYEAPADQGETVQAKRASYGEKYYSAYHTVIEEPKEEIEEKIPEENTNQPDTNGGSDDKPVETPAGDGATTEVEKEPEYIKTPEEAQNFIMKLLNHIIDFIVRLFKK
ncbi:MAG: N-acetylmuramoyl-L-alanine amidase [Alistipes sp.]|nr:N-acetylmuramoyl-L-alanine amidase [Alistipes sp.]